MTEGGSGAADGRRLVALAGLAFALVSLDQGILPPLLPLVASRLDTPPARASVLVTAYAVGAGLLPLLAGPWSDRRGRAAALVAGLLLFSAGGALFAIASALPAALAARALSGMGAGVVSFSVTAAVGDVVEYRDRTRAMATLVAANLTALIAGPALIAIAPPLVSPPVVFASLAALGLPLAVVLRAAAPAMPRREPSGPRPSYAAFFRRRETRLGLAVSFLSSAAIAPPIVFLSSWLVARHGFDLRDVGLVYLAGCAAPLLSAAIAGRLARRFPNREMIVVSSLPLAAAVLLVAPMADVATFFVPVLFAIAVLVQTVRSAALQSLHTALVAESERGSYVVLKNSFAQAGIAAGALLGGLFYGSGERFLSVAALSAAAAVLSAVATLPLREDALPGREGASPLHRAGVPPV